MPGPEHTQPHPYALAVQQHNGGCDQLGLPVEPPDHFGQGAVIEGHEQLVSRLIVAAPRRARLAVAAGAEVATVDHALVELEVRDLEPGPLDAVGVLDVLE